MNDSRRCSKQAMPMVIHKETNQLPKNSIFKLKVARRHVEKNDQMNISIELDTYK